MSRPLIITGMHRSGTSFVAELFQSAGLHIGERLFPGDAGNPRGYFEDDAFLSLQREMLAKACPPGVPGWPDWGWTKTEALDEPSWEAYGPAMQALAASRAEHRPWGWKDPRTSLLLEPWLRVLPGVRCVFVVREPWKVAASVRRLPAEIFQTRPDVGVRVWMYYNRQLLDFAREHPGRCAWVALPQLINAPVEVLSRTIADLGLTGLHVDAARTAEIVTGRLLDAKPFDAESEHSFRREYPESVMMWEELLALSTHG